MVRKKMRVITLIAILLFNSACSGKTVVVTAPNGKSIVKDTLSPIEKFFNAIVPVILIGGYMMYANKCAETGNCNYR